MNKITRIFAFLLIVLCIAAAGGFIYITQPLSFVDGTVKVAALKDSVRLLRDNHGAVHIFASDDKDAAAALGFAHAQDRLFQIMMMRRAAQGRLSEILGKDFLAYDKKMRVLGFARLAQAHYGFLSAPVQDMLKAYAAGVNAYLEAHKGLWPAEFRLLNFVPEPWAAQDGLLWGKMMAWQLSNNLDTEIFRAQLLRNGVAKDNVEKMFPVMDGEGVADERSQVREKEAARLPFIPHSSSTIPFSSPHHDASNIFVLDGTRTQSGKPLLANDPHLQLDAPILWYLARIVTPERSIRGATAPGMPFFPLGQNDHVAWGFTTTGSDVQDLVFIAPDDLTAHEEEIKVKGEAPVRVTVRHSKDGAPILSDVRDDVAAITPQGKVAALHYTGFANDDRTIEALYHINHATDRDGVLAATSYYKAPPQNLMTADDQGHIAFIAVGDVPIRSQHDGFYPLEPALKDAAVWVGIQPQKPMVINPDHGLLFNANNAVVDRNTCAWPSCYLTREWAEPYRAMRLEALLKDASKMDARAATQPMLDVLSLPAVRLLPKWLRALPDDDITRALKAWPGTMRADFPEPLIFHTLLQKLLFKAFGDAAQAVVVWPRLWALETLTLDQMTVRAAYDEALTDLRARFGTDWRHWRWGDVHKAPFKNIVWANVPLLGPLVSLERETDGDAYTLQRAAPSAFTPDAALRDDHGAGYRAVYDLADKDVSLFMIAGGQSGQIFTKHYGDLLPQWQRGDFIQLKGHADDIEKNGGTVMMLTP